MLLFGHKHLNDYVRLAWEDDAPLLVRSFVEQGIDPNLSTVTGLEKIRLHPPGYGDESSLAVFMPPADIHAIWKHQQKLKRKYPKLETNNISELPNPVQFRRAVPAVILCNQTQHLTLTRPFDREVAESGHAQVIPNRFYDEGLDLVCQDPSDGSGLFGSALQKGGARG